MIIIIFASFFPFFVVVIGASPQPCSNMPAWNETFLDKVYYILHNEDLTTYKYSNVAETCNGTDIQKLVVDSLAENDFIVEMMKKYQPDIESKVFLACPSDTNLPPLRRFKCRDSGAIYKEGNDSSQGFWSKRLNFYLSLFHLFYFFTFRGKQWHRFKLPEVKLPEVKMPEVKMPEVKMPEERTPEENI